MLRQLRCLVSFFHKIDFLSSKKKLHWSKTSPFFLKNKLHKNLAEAKICTKLPPVSLQKLAPISLKTDFICLTKYFLETLFFMNYFRLRD